jgi:integrase
MPRYAYKRADKRIEQSEIEQMLFRTNSQKIRALISALYISGARISEVLALRIKDFKFKDNGDLEINIITLKRDRRNKLPYQENRRLILGKGTPFLHILVGYFNQLKHSCEYIPDEETLEKKLFWFCAKPNSNRTAVNRILKKLNPMISPHAFRHSRCQKLADNGATAIQIKAWTGHKKLDMISEYIENSSRLVEPLKNMIN